ncbi:MAG: DUF6600 domain-containing protein [Myxococcota bacterium]
MAARRAHPNIIVLTVLAAAAVPPATEGAPEIADLPAIIDAPAADEAPAEPALDDAPEAAPAVAVKPVTNKVAGKVVKSVDDFKEPLDAYGDWQESDEYGDVFVPDDPGYQPYAQGYWEDDEDQGATWVATEPIGKVACHYGRWVYQGRWVWVPDTQYGPGWVAWEESAHGVAWAPLPPERHGRGTPAARPVPVAWVDQDALYDRDWSGHRWHGEHVDEERPTARPVPAPRPDHGGHGHQSDHHGDQQADAGTPGYGGHQGGNGQGQGDHGNGQGQGDHGNGQGHGDHGNGSGQGHGDHGSSNGRVRAITAMARATTATARATTATARAAGHAGSGRHGSGNGEVRATTATARVRTRRRFGRRLSRASRSVTAA